MKPQDSDLEITISGDRPNRDRLARLVRGLLIRDCGIALTVKGSVIGFAHAGDLGFVNGVIDRAKREWPINAPTINLTVR